MTFQVDQGNVRQGLPGWLDLLRIIWVDAILIFVRKFAYLRKEIVAATWGRFFLTTITTLFVGSGLYQLAIGLSIEGIYEKTLRLPFNLFGYWWAQTLWSVVTLAIINIPIILLAAYLSFNWVSRAKEENAYWLQEAQMLVITWTITFLLIQAVRLLGGVVTDAFYRSTTNFLTRASVEHRYTPLTSYIFSGLFTAPIIAYRYNVRLRGNRILHRLNSRNRWLLLAFQFILLEGGTLLVSRLVLNLPFVTNLYQSLSKLWL